MLCSIKIISFSQGIPQGWRKVTFQQGNLIKNQLLSILSNWSIVAFQTGCINGKGYGNQIKQTFGNQCGEGLIVYSLASAPSNPSQKSLTSFFLKQNESGYSKANFNNFVKQQLYYHQDQLSQYKKTNTPLGVVVKVPLLMPVPIGYRTLVLGEGVQIKQHLNQLLDQWSVVAFQNGKIDGYGYGNNISQTYGQQCGQKFIVKNQ